MSTTITKNQNQNHLHPLNKTNGNQTDSLTNAKIAKQDEFYTQLNDINKELQYYKTQLRNKIILCNCDNPFESNFFKYFVLNFNILGLKKLIAINYANSRNIRNQPPLFEIEDFEPENKEPRAIEINEIPNHNTDNLIDITNIEYLLRSNSNVTQTLNGNGDFRSQECIEFLKQADIVITNPPFSLFREYIKQLINYNKQFLIIGNVNAISYKEIFKLIKENKLWLGESIHSGDREFRVPNHYPLNTINSRIDSNGNKFIRVKGVRWFTNMDNPKRHAKITLFNKYDPAKYPHYDNFDAIEVTKVAEIPINYFDIMGVPITFLDKYNPQQFEIIGIDRYTEGNRTPGKRMQINKQEIYARILIKRKQTEN